MKKIDIRALEENEDIPYDLLLLADETVEAIGRYIHDSIIYIAEYKDVAIGVYVMKKISPSEVEIMNIAVRVDMQGEGIGSQLLAHAEEHAREAGYKSLLIATADAGFRQLYLYQKVGFSISDIRCNFVVENYPQPIFENGVQLRHMILLRKEL